MLIRLICSHARFIEPGKNLISRNRPPKRRFHHGQFPLAVMNDIVTSDNLGHERPYHMFQRHKLLKYKGVDHVR